MNIGSGSYLMVHSCVVSRTCVLERGRQGDFGLLHLIVKQLLFSGDELLLRLLPCLGMGVARQVLREGYFQCPDTLLLSDRFVFLVPLVCAVLVLLLKNIDEAPVHLGVLP